MIGVFLGYQMCTDFAGIVKLGMSEKRRWTVANATSPSRLNIPVQSRVLLRNTSSPMKLLFHAK